MATLFGFVVAVAQITRYDVWALLAGGRYIVAHGLPATDPFSFTAADRRWVNHSWLSQVLLYLAYARLGPVALVLLKGAAGAATVAIVFRSALRRSRAPVAAALVAGLVAIGVGPWWELRPQVLTYLIWAAFLAAHAAWRAGDARALWLLPPLMAAWVNVHAAFALGVVALALWIAGLAGVRALKRLGRRSGGEPAPDGRSPAPRARDGSADPAAPRPAPPALRPLLVAAGVVLLATLANPWGWRAWAFPLAMTTSRRALAASVDWYPPDFLDPALLPALLALPGLALALALPRVRPPLDEGLLLGFLMAASLRSARHLPLCLIAGAPLLARLVAASASRAVAARPRLAPLGTGLAVAGLAAGILGVLGWTRAPDRNPFLQELDEVRYPVEAVAFMRRARPPAPLFNAYVWAGYELWALPEYRVFIDNRFEVYPQRVIDDYVAVTYLDAGWEAVLDRWRIRTLLVDRGSPLARALAASGRWRPVFAAREAAVFVDGRDAEVRAFLGGLERGGAAGTGAP
jgi:hypothetical protein